MLPRGVHVELTAKNTPEKVKEWLDEGRRWLRVQEIDARLVETVSADLDPGEREAIALAETLGADYLIIDDHDGRRQALNRKLNVIGTLGVLDRADQLGLVEDLAKDAQLNRESLYRTLSRSGNPQLKSLTAVLAAFGLKLRVESR